MRLLLCCSWVVLCESTLPSERKETSDVRKGGAENLGRVLDDADDDLVGHEAARLHDCLRLLADVGARRNRRAQHVSGRERGDLLLSSDLGRVRALACWRASSVNQDEGLVNVVCALFVPGEGRKEGQEPSAGRN